MADPTFRPRRSAFARRPERAAPSELRRLSLKAPAPRASPSLARAWWRIYACLILPLTLLAWAVWGSGHGGAGLR